MKVILSKFFKCKVMSNLSSDFRPLYLNEQNETLILGLREYYCLIVHYSSFAILFVLEYAVCLMRFGQNPSSFFSLFIMPSETNLFTQSFSNAAVYAA